MGPPAFALGLLLLASACSAQESPADRTLRLAFENDGALIVSLHRF